MLTLADRVELRRWVMAQLEALRREGAHHATGEGHAAFAVGYRAAMSDLLAYLRAKEDEWGDTPPR